MLAGGFAVIGPAAPVGAQRPASTSQLGSGGTDSQAVTSTTTPRIEAAANSVVVLGQSPWVSDRQSFHLRVQIGVSDPSNEQIDLVVYSRLTTRSGFDEAMLGQIQGYQIYTLRVSVTALRQDPAGGVDIDIPVNPANGAPTAGIPPFYTSAGSAVFPVQIGLDRVGVPQGPPVSTFMVYGQPTSRSGLPKLAVSLTLPIGAAPAVDDHGQIGPLSRTQSAQLADLVDTLMAHPDIRVTLTITPETLEALDGRSASALDRSTLTTIIDLVHDGNVEVVPNTYANVPLQGWGAAGLATELSNQLATGSSVLRGVLDLAPSAPTWVINGSLDDAALRTLQSTGATQFILPNADLSALPAVAQETTFALPTQLEGAGGRALVYGADPGLTADFSNPGGPVLAASQLLAETAMIQLETPGLTRGIAVLPPLAWSENPTFIDTLLTGLEGHPLLDPVTASGLFEAVRVAPLPRSLVAAQGTGVGVSTGSGTGGSTVSSPSETAGSGSGSASTGISSTGAGSPTAVAGGTGGTGSTASTPPVKGTGSASGGSLPTGPSGVTGASAVTEDIGRELGPDIPTIRALRRGLAGMVAVLPQEAPRVVTLNKDLLTAESTDLIEAQRQGLLAQIQKAITKVTSLITLPRSSSITLTSTKGEIPLTVLSSSSVRARVELRMASERLIFQHFSPPNGRCAVPTSTTEVCDLTLTTQNTTLKVPVEARSSGVFPVQVSLWTPDGSQLIAQARDTVRSTAVSGVGVILIVLAIISLGIWWVRDLRHGRRARQLVPPPEEDVPGDNAGGLPDGKGVNEIDQPEGQDDEAGLRLHADLPDPETMVHQLFASPAPEHRDQASGTLS
jgi:hypothetical protein